MSRTTLRQAAALQNGNRPLCYQTGALRNNSLAAGLIGYWSFDAGQGAVVADLSGNGYDAVWNGTDLDANNTVQWTAAGIINNGGLFNGATGKRYALVSGMNLGSGTGVLAYGTPFSCDGWLLPTAFTSFGMLITFGGSGIELRHNSTTGIPQVNWSGTSFTAAAALALNVFSHEMLTYDGLNLLLYVNNQVVISAQSPSTTLTPGQQASFGSRSGGADNWTGTIDEVGMWNRCLTPGEVAQRYGAGYPTRPF